MKCMRTHRSNLLKTRKSVIIFTIGLLDVSTRTLFHKILIFSGYLLFNFLSKFRNNISYLNIIIIVRTINGLISVTLVLFTIMNYKTRTTFYSAISDYNVNVIGVTKRDKSASSSKFRSVNPLFLKNLLKHEGHRSDIVN